ncbi:MAG: serine/threonine protein kinase [Deltaproteobacteria bacterium]|nr:serine/threonine protein kinase [Deltaproteobacteria bacterium]
MALTDRSVDRRYRIGRRIAVRGSAEVYDAVSGEDGRRRAIKRIIGRADDEEAHSLAIRETAVVATLDHPNIVEVVDVGQSASDYFLVTDFVDGPTLAELLTALRTLNRKVPEEVVCGIVGQVARGLAHAHERELPDGTNLGIVHRDVSPDNIMVGLDGVPKLIDFGGATLAGHGLTRAGAVRGLARSMSPEQALGQPVDRRTDVYGLGALLFELLAGEPLIRAQNQGELLKKISTGDTGSFALRLPHVDRDLVAIVEQCTKRDPDARPHSARDVERKLDRFRAARQLRIDAKGLARLVEDAAPNLKPRRSDSPGELERSQLTLTAEKGALESFDGLRPNVILALAAHSSEEQTWDDPAKKLEPLSSAKADSSEKQEAPSPPETPSKPEQPRIESAALIGKAVKRHEGSPPDRLLRRLIVLCALLFVIVSILAGMLIFDP